MIPPRWLRVDAAAWVSARLPSIPHITLARCWARASSREMSSTTVDETRSRSTWRWDKEQRWVEWHLEREIRARGDRGTCRPSVPHRDGAGMSVASSAKWAVVPQPTSELSHTTKRRPVLHSLCFAHQQLTINHLTWWCHWQNTSLHPSILKHEREIHKWRPTTKTTTTTGVRTLRTIHRRGTVSTDAYARTSRMRLRGTRVTRGTVAAGNGRQRQQRCHDDALYPAIRIFFQVAACRAQSVRTGSRSDNARATLRRILRIRVRDGRDATRRETGRGDDDDYSPRLPCTRRVNTISP